MKKNPRFIAMTGAVLFAASALISAFPQTYIYAGEEAKTLDIIFTHDTHSHLESFLTYYEEEDQMLGGFSRIMTLIQEQKEKNPDTLLLDGGDFSMGTLVQTVFEDQAAEMRMLGELGMDITTLGNHEFDYRSKGLANMLETTAESGDPYPAMVVCNVDWDTMLAEGLTEGQQLLYDAFSHINVQDYRVLTKGDVDIAVIGVFGIDALACAPTCELLFKDPVEAVTEIVAEIKEKEDVDMIVCVSHSGTWEDESKSEDEILAKKVPELDLIVSAHTHTELPEPILHGDTWIASCGEYGKRIGMLSMEQKENGRWDVTSYDLPLISQDIEEDPSISEKVDGFLSTVDENYLADFGYTRDTVLTENSVVFCRQKDLKETHTEQNLGNIISDAFLYAVENMADYNGPQVDVTVAPAGCIRDTYTVGEITVENVYNSYSLGFGADEVPGYPLIGVYLTGKELKLAAEVDASVSDFMTDARLYFSGLSMTFNPHRIILNKVSETALVRDGNSIAIDDDQLYYVVADLYSGQMLSAVTDLSYGILSLVPKHADGTPIKDFEDVILKENGKELKAWDAIARYMASFEDTDGNGIANVPESYASPDGRKVEDTSWNPVNLLKNPNKFGVIIAAVVILLIVILVLIVRLIIKLIKKISHKRNIK